MKMTLSNIQNSKGVNLVELMVGLALGSFMSIGVLQMYVSNRQTFSNNEAVAQIQDNSRFAIKMISDNARMAGYTGCISKDRGLSDTNTIDDIPITNLLNNSTGVNFNFGEAIVGYNDVGSSPPPDLATALTGDPSPEAGTDVLVLRGAGGDNVPIVSNNNGAQFFAANTNSTETCPSGALSLSGLCDNDIVLASDCEKSVIFQITNIVNASGRLNIGHSATGNPGNAPPASWGGNSGADTIGTDGEIIKMYTRIYYIGDNNGRPALYRKSNVDAAEVIADNIIDMQVLYGEDTTATANYEVDQYSTADAVADWSRVRSVRVNLLIASDNDNVVQGGAAMTVPFNGQNYVATDRRLYQVATTTVVLRNRAQ